MSEADAPRALGAGSEEYFRGRRVGVLLEEVVLDLPGEVDAEPVGELDLVESLLKESELVPVSPRARQLMLVEDAEFHLCVPPRFALSPTGRRRINSERARAARTRR